MESHLDSPLVHDEYDTTRRILFGAVNRTATADYHGHQLATYVEGGLNLTWNQFDVQPLFGLQYIYLYQNNFTERGAGALNLAVNSTDTDSFRTVLGTRISRSLCTQRGILVVPELRLQWMHELFDDNQAIQSNFVSVPGGSFRTQGLQLGRDFGVFGPGVTIHLNDRVSLLANYDFQVSSNQTSHAGSGGLQYVW